MSLGRSNCRGFSCWAAADNSSNGLRDPAAMSSAENSRSASLSSSSICNDLTDLLPDGTLTPLPAADAVDSRHFDCSLWRLLELQFDAVSSSCDYTDIDTYKTRVVWSQLSFTNRNRNYLKNRGGSKSRYSPCGDDFLYDLTLFTSNVYIAYSASLQYARRMITL